MDIEEKVDIMKEWRKIHSGILDMAQNTVKA